MSEDRLAQCTEDIDGAIVAAWHESWEVAGVDPNQPPDPAKSDMALDHFLRENPTLVAELARRYREIISPSPEEDVPDPGYLAYWLGEHGDKLHDPSL